MISLSDLSLLRSVEKNLPQQKTKADGEDYDRNIFFHLLLWRGGQAVILLAQNPQNTIVLYHRTFGATCERTPNICYLAAMRSGGMDLSLRP